MIRNKLYDELEKEGYSFCRAGYNGQFMPEVFSLTDPDDWATINLAVVINGQHQVDGGPNCSQKTVQILQRVIDETSKPDYSDYYSKALFKEGEN
jgi:hypothetical protein